MSKPKQRTPISGVFRALADPTRLRLLNLMAGKEICVCYFVEILGLSQPKVSRHLGYLRRAGLVTARREGKWMHYGLAVPTDPTAAQILGQTLKHLRERPEMKRDATRLRNACCQPESFVVLQRAPLPALRKR